MSDHVGLGLTGEEVAAVMATISHTTSRDHAAAALFAMMIWRRRVGALSVLPA